MDELKRLITATTNTLRGIRVDDEGGTWQKMLAIKAALGRMLEIIDGIEKEDDHGESD